MNFRNTLLTLIFLGYVQFALAQSPEEELRAQIQSGIDLWNQMDSTALVEFSSSGFRGFGFRSQPARSPESLSPEAAKLLHRWFDSLEHYKITPGEMKIEIEDDIALVWGNHVEDFKHKGRPPERITVRSSATYRRVENGVWHQLLSHRDTQKFENGRYIPQYVE